MKNSLLLFITLIVFASCEHNDYADPVPGSPEFLVGGLRNGQPFTLAAGENGLIQTTSIERNKYGVLEWTSSFVEAGCDDCIAEFKLSVNDAQGMTYQNSGNSEILYAGNLPFASAPSDSGFTNCSFELVYPTGGNDIDVNDFHLNGGPQINDFPITLNPGINIVDADFNFDDEPGQIKVTQAIYAGSHHKLSAPFRYRYGGAPNGDDHLHLYFPSPQPGGLRAKSWEWGNPLQSDTSHSSEIDITLNNLTFIRLYFHNDEIDVDGYYDITWNGDTEIWENDNEDNNGSLMLAPSIQTTWETGELNYSKVFIDYLFDGKHYTSVNPNQTAVLNITSFRPYSSADRPELNRQVEANFTITLYEVGNPQNTLELSNCSGTFGFAIPE